MTRSESREPRRAVMFPLTPGKTEEIPAFKENGRARVAIEHALAYGRPGLWGEAVRRPQSVILMREVDDRWEAFGVGLGWPAMAWLAQHGQGRGVSLIAPPLWEESAESVFGPVERAPVETWTVRAPGAKRPASPITTRRLARSDALAFTAVAPGWALRAWGSFPELIEHGAGFGVPSGAGFASVAWTFEQGRDHTAIAVSTVPRFRRLGLGRAAALTLVDHVVRATGLVPIWWTNPENEASRALAQSLGFARQTTETLLRWPPGIPRLPR